MFKEDNLKIIFMGPVGSGKSTQAKLLAKQFKIPHLEIGGLLRQMGKTDKSVKKILQSGKLVPDELVLRTLGWELGRHNYQAGFVLDGAPRTLNQARKLPFNPDLVIYLRVRDSENIKRLLLRGRHDDTEELVRARLEIYHQDTEPILDFYRQKGKLLEVNGEPAIEVIFEDIINKLKEWYG